MTPRTLARRDIMAGAAGLAASALLPATARAADWPTQDIKFIVPYGAGGGFDLYVRELAPVMQKLLPAPVNIVPDNVPAGGGVIGVGQLARAHPDGYTIGILNIPGMFVLQRSGAGSFDLKKLSYLGSAGHDTYAMAVAANSPLRNMADLRALSAQRPVKFTCTGREGTAFSATLIAANLLGLRSQMILGYKGSNDYVVAAMRGDGDAVVTTVPLIKQMVEAKMMRVLATFEQHSSFPGADDATTLAQPELTKIILERIIAAPPRLPAEIQAVLARALAGAVADPTVAAWAAKTGTTLQSMTPEQAAHTVAEQAEFYDKWKQVIDAT